MNKHARKDLTESTLIALAAILTQAGYRYSTGGVSITIPRKVAEDITALAYDLNNHNARKAKLVEELSVGDYVRWKLRDAYDRDRRADNGGEVAS